MTQCQPSVPADRIVRQTGALIGLTDHKSVSEGISAELKAAELKAAELKAAELKATARSCGWNIGDAAPGRRHALSVETRRIVHDRTDAREFVNEFIRRRSKNAL